MLSLTQGLEMKNESCAVKVRIWADVLLQNLCLNRLNVPRVKETARVQRSFLGKKAVSQHGLMHSRYPLKFAE